MPQESDFRIVRYLTQRERIGRRGVPAIPAGTNIHLIQHKGTGRFFAWAYRDSSRIPEVISNLVRNWKSTDLDFNFKSERDHCVHT